MKMTPEQKAFYELGKADANLAVARDFLRLLPFELKKYEDPVLRERAACRAWMSKDKRHCANCKYTDCLAWNEPCCECPRCGNLKNADQWEPMESQN